MTASVEPAADALAHEVPRVRGISTPDAVAVTLIAAIVGAFHSTSFAGVVLIAGIGCVYAAFRITRGSPPRRRALAVTAALVLPIGLAFALVQNGF